MTQHLISLKEWQDLCTKNGLAEVEEETLTDNCYTNKQIHEMLEGDRQALTRLLTDPLDLLEEVQFLKGRRAAISGLVDCDPIVRIHRGENQEILAGFTQYLSRQSVATALEATTNPAIVEKLARNDKVQAIVAFIKTLERQS